MKTRVYGEGPLSDEGGRYRLVDRSTPSWVAGAQKHCMGCHNNFYNGRANCTGDNWCFSLRKAYAKRKTRPRCYR